MYRQSEANLSMLKQKQQSVKPVSTPEKQANPYFEVPMKKGRLYDCGMAKLKLEKSLPKKVWQEIVSWFDGRNIRPESGHWWSTNTKEDRPSFAPEITGKGTAFIHGSDFTEGKLTTQLGISRDGKTIIADRAWNIDCTKRILEKHHVPFTFDDYCFISDF